MTRIIYKDGCEGQNRLDSIEGIEIELLNGQRALIYPKYKECEIFSDIKPLGWGERCREEIGALKQMSAEKATTKLYKLDSPAAKHVRQFNSEKYGSFNLPTLLAAMEIGDQAAEIDHLAETIEGAEFLGEFSLNIWSGCRYDTLNAWFYHGRCGFASYRDFSDSHLVVPTVVY